MREKRTRVWSVKKREGKPCFTPAKSGSGVFDASFTESAEICTEVQNVRDAHVSVLGEPARVSILLRGADVQTVYQTKTQRQVTLWINHVLNVFIGFLRAPILLVCQRETTYL